MKKHLRIGISSNYAAANRSSSLPERGYLDHHYFDVLADYQAVPVPLVPLEPDGQLTALLDIVDGVIFTGGYDLDSSLWDEPLHEKAVLVHPRRQKFEFRLYQAVRKRRLPVLGICLGLQLINVAHGGSLYQHLPETPGQLDHGCDGRLTEHQIRLHEAGRLRQLAAETATTVPSCHHQGIHRVGDGLLASAWTQDGVTEAVEDPDYPYLLAVQWHPERDTGHPLNQRIIASFIDACC